MKISIFGLGYVGCVSLGCLAQNDHDVVGVDIIESKINLINKGKPTIIEKDIDKIIEKNFSAGKISATKDYVNAVKSTDISIICVGTPPTNEGHLNLNFVFQTAKQIGEALKGKESFHVIVIRSTVMPGTNKKVGEIIEEASDKKRNIDFSVVSNPEFLREGTAVYDYYNPAHTIIGGDSEKAIEIIKKIYSEIKAPIEVVNIEVAEIIKYINNSFHALKVSFANEVGNICKKIGIDSYKVMDLFVKDTKLNISSIYLRPGFSYGGSCLPKDLKGLKTIAHDYYLYTPILEAINESNELQKKILFEKIIEKQKKNIGILGLSFKSGTDDLRYSPIVEVTEWLMGKGFKISIYDKDVNLSNLTGTNKEYIEKHLPHLQNLISADLSFVIERSELLVISHKKIEFQSLIEKYKNKIFIDLVRVIETNNLSNYEGICW